MPARSVAPVDDHTAAKPVTVATYVCSQGVDVALIEIQVMPRGGHPPADEPYYFVERALDVIKASGLKFEVEPLGTTLEGDFDAAIATCIKAHKAVLEAGADSAYTIIKISHRREGTTTMADLVTKHRPPSSS
jgi:uncharacterized protein (TIGR00106 family)